MRNGYRYSHFIVMIHCIFSLYVIYYTNQFYKQWYAHIVGHLLHTNQFYKQWNVYVCSVCFFSNWWICCQTQLMFPFISGTSLKDLPLDDFSLTEILRLHFLSSGAINRTGIKFDYQRRGGFTPHDDPGLEFRRQEMALIKSLGETSLVDCSPGETNFSRVNFYIKKCFFKL